MHVTWYTAMTMDGRVAGPHDDLGFLAQVESPDDAGAQWEAFLAGVDALVVGAGTVRWLEREGHGGRPASGIPTWVVTHDEGLVERIAAGADDVHRHAGELDTLVATLEAAGHEHVWLCGGGDVAGQLLAIDRIDDVVVTIAPVAVGSGPALFDTDTAVGAHRFELREQRIYAGDAVRLHWTRRGRPHRAIAGVT